MPITNTDFQQTQIDLLNFSRKLLLKAHFHNVSGEDISLIKPISNFIPKMTKYPVLKSVINDLEVFANELKDLPFAEVNDNLTPSQRKGLNSFKSNDTLYFKADKGTSVVLLDKDFYKEKVMEKLSTNNFQEIPRNVDYFIHLKVKALVKKYALCLTKSEKKACTEFDFSPTNIYGLPKIHKSKIIKEALPGCKNRILSIHRPADLSLRIIFGGPNSPTVGLANLLNGILKPFVFAVHSVVIDSIDLIVKMPIFGPDDLCFIEIWSVDVKDMYPSIDHKLGLKVLRFWLEKYPSLKPSRFSVEFILEAMALVLDNNIGYFNGKFFKQLNGTATGIKPAPPYANLVMGYLEIQLYYKLIAKSGQQVATYFWNHYRRYLDDGQIMWDSRIGDFSEVFFQLLNDMHPQINFTKESSSTKLTYLDVNIVKTDNGFQTVIHNKETDSDSYLPFSSCHPRHTTTSIPFNLARRVRALTDDTSICKVKLSNLEAKLQSSGYPQGLVKTATREALLLNVEDLRKRKVKDLTNNEISFVHTFNPALPQLYSEVKSLTSRVFSTKELRPIFGGTRIIKSQREPPSLGRLLQHSRFDELPVAVEGTGVTKCGHSKCESCKEILEVNELFFRNSGVTFKIKKSMNCLVRNVIYALFCNGCGNSYIGETVNFRERMNGHRNKSTSSLYANAEVSKHLLNCGQGFKSCPIFKVREQSKIARLVIEDKLMKWLKPDLNTDQRNLLHLL